MFTESSRGKLVKWLMKLTRVPIITQTLYQFVSQERWNAVTAVRGLVCSSEFIFVPHLPHTNPLTPLCGRPLIEGNAWVTVYFGQYFLTDFSPLELPSNSHLVFWHVCHKNVLHGNCFRKSVMIPYHGTIHWISWNLMALNVWIDYVPL